jgi:hypothetical protein
MISIALCALAWLVALIKFRIIWLNRVWKTDPIALSVWLAMLFFAITMTFLMDSFAVVFNSLTLNNLSRLIAYSSISITLFFITTASLYTFNTPRGMRISRLIAPLLIANLFTLIFIYARYISRLPEWRNYHIPQDNAGALFMSTLFMFSFLLCLILVSQNIRYLHGEKALLMRIRLMTIVMTALIAGFYFTVKMILVAGYFWTPLSSDTIVMLSKLLLILSAVMFAISFVPNRYYMRFIGLINNLSNWRAIRDLEYLLSRLDYLCPPVALEESKPSLRSFLKNSDYYLYRATIRILDGKTMLADYLNNEANNGRPDWWDDALLQEAKQIYWILSSVHTSGDFLDIVRSFRISSKQLLGQRQYQSVEAIS